MAGGPGPQPPSAPPEAVPRGGGPLTMWRQQHGHGLWGRSCAPTCCPTMAPSRPFPRTLRRPRNAQGRLPELGCGAGVTRQFSLEGGLPQQEAGCCRSSINAC